MKASTAVLLISLIIAFAQPPLEAKGADDLDDFRAEFYFGGLQDFLDFLEDFRTEFLLHDFLQDFDDFRADFYFGGLDDLPIDWREDFAAALAAGRNVRLMVFGLAMVLLPMQALVEQRFVHNAGPFAIHAVPFAILTLTMNLYAGIDDLFAGVVDRGIDAGRQLVGQLVVERRRLMGWLMGWLMGRPGWLMMGQQSAAPDRMREMRILGGLSGFIIFSMVLILLMYRSWKMPRLQSRANTKDS